MFNLYCERWGSLLDEYSKCRDNVNLIKIECFKTFFRGNNEDEAGSSSLIS